MEFPRVVLPGNSIHTIGRFLMHRLHMEMLSSSASVVIDETGKYLTFKVGTEKYEMGIAKIIEIVRFNDAVNRASDAAGIPGGVVNYKGQILPAIDFRRKRRFNRQSAGTNASMLITEVKRNSETVVVALMVNQVVDLRTRRIADHSGNPSPASCKTGHKGSS